MRLGAVTQAFFRKGDELAATEFENVPHDDPMLVPPKLGFRGFDRVPRRRAPLLIVLLLLVGAGAIAFKWQSIHGVSSGAGRAAAAFGTKASAEWVRLKEAVRSWRAAW